MLQWFAGLLTEWTDYLCIHFLYIYLCQKLSGWASVCRRLNVITLLLLSSLNVNMEQDQGEKHGFHWCRSLNPWNNVCGTMCDMWVMTTQRYSPASNPLIETIQRMSNVMRNGVCSIVFRRRNRKQHWNWLCCMLIRASLRSSAPGLLTWLPQRCAQTWKHTPATFPL